MTTTPTVFLPRPAAAFCPCGLGSSGNYAVDFLAVVAGAVAHADADELDAVVEPPSLLPHPASATTTTAAGAIASNPIRRRARLRPAPQELLTTASSPRSPRA
jgi:hypothetical protein